MKDYTDKQEQETVIQFDRTQDEMSIWTSDTTVITKLDKIYPRHHVYKTNRHVWAVEYLVPKRLLTFRSKIISRKERENDVKEKMEKARASRSVAKKKKKGGR